MYKKFRTVSFRDYFQGNPGRPDFYRAASWNVKEFEHPRISKNHQDTENMRFVGSKCA